MAQIHLTTKNEMNVTGYILFLIKTAMGQIRIHLDMPHNKCRNRRKDLRSISYKQEEP